MGRKREKRQKRTRRLFRVTQARDVVSTTYSYPTNPLPAMLEEETRLNEDFETEYGEIAALWSSIDTLRRILVEKRPSLEDTSTYRAALDLLAAKALGDARGAYVLVRCGYLLASLGPLRASQEAADLMQYFRLNPDEVDAWRAEDEKFASLGWIRKELPVDPTLIYDFLAYGLHANWRFIPHLMSDASVTDTNYEITPGPIRNSAYTVLFALSSAHQALRALGELYNHAPVVGQPWRDQYEELVRNLERLLQEFRTLAKRDLAAVGRLVAEAEAASTPTQD